MEIMLVAPAGWATDGLQGLLKKLAPQADVQVTHDPASLGRLSHSPALILLDVDVAPARAQSMAAAAVRKHPSSRVVAMGSQKDKRHAESLMDAGVLTYLPHGFSENVILGTLRLILDNLPGRETGPKTPTSDSSREQEKSDERKGGNDFGLTDRQVEVLAQICEGRSNRVIAQNLGIKEGVVKLHVTAVFKGLNVRSRAEAMVVASRSQSVNFRQIKRAEGGKLDLEWLLGHMSHRRCPKDTVLFRMGDSAEELYYLQRGTVRLQEINEDLQSGTMFGEIGIFSPNHKRTYSAVCAGPTDVFTLTSEQVKRLYLLNPQFALCIVHLISQRLMADRVRVT